jgi:hypothetical protein
MLKMTNTVFKQGVVADMTKPNLFSDSEAGCIDKPSTVHLRNLPKPCAVTFQKKYTIKLIQETKAQ